MRKEFQQHLYDELCHRQGLTEENLNTNYKLRALALELAADEKYGGLFADLTFSHGWLTRFRKAFNLHSDSDLLRDSENPVVKTLSLADKQYILYYAGRNPQSTLREIATHFSEIFDHEISHSMVHIIIRENIGSTESKLQTAEETDGLKTWEKFVDTKYEEIEGSSTETDLNWEAARAQFRHSMMKQFWQDLNEEFFRRQTQTKENLTTDEKLRALALELVADAKYGGHFAGFICSNNWLTQFRRDFKVNGHNSEHKVVKPLSKEDKQCIVYYANKNQHSTLQEIASHFAENFGYEIDHTIVHEILRENINSTESKLQTFEETDALKNREKMMDKKRDENVSSEIEYCNMYNIPVVSVDAVNHIKETFSQDVYDELSRRQSLTEETLTSNEEIRALALELATDPKYKGVLANHKFSSTWVLHFRKKFNFQYSDRRCLTTSEKQIIIEYSDNNPQLNGRQLGEHFSTLFGRNVTRFTIANIRKNRQRYMDENADVSSNTFKQDLYEELSRRQSLTDDDIFSNENLRAIALELARKPKYKQSMANFKCSESWMTKFRKQFHKPEESN